MSRTSLLLTFLLLTTIGLRAQSLSTAWSDEFSLPGVSGRVYHLIPSDSGVWVRGTFKSVDGRTDLPEFAHYSLKSGWSGAGLDHNKFGTPVIPGYRYEFTEYTPAITSYGLLVPINNGQSVSGDAGIARYSEGVWSFLGGAVVSGSVAWVGSIDGLPAMGGFKLKTTDTAAPASLIVLTPQGWQPRVPECITGVVEQVIELEEGKLLITGTNVTGCELPITNRILIDGDSVSVPADSIEISLVTSYQNQALLVPKSGLVSAPLVFDGTTYVELSTNYPAADSLIYRSITSGNGDTIYMAAEVKNRGRVRIYMYDGTAWSEMPGVVEGIVEDIAATASGELFIAGSFGRVNGNMALNIARWSENGWIPLVREGIQYNGILGDINDVVTLGDTIWIGGKNLQGLYLQGAHTMLRYTKGQWETIPEEPDGEVREFRLIEDVMYVSGCFDRIGNIEARNLARYRNGAWEAFGSGPAFCPDALDIRDGRITVGGQFSNVPSLSIWDNQQWSTPLRMPGSRIEALLDMGDSLIAGIRAGNSGAQLFTIRGESWQAWEHSELAMKSKSSEAKITSLFERNGNLWMVGAFDSLDHTPIGGVAWFDGTWHGLEERLAGTGGDVAQTAEGLLMAGFTGATSGVITRDLDGELVFLKDGATYLQPLVSTTVVGQGVDDVTVMGDRIVVSGYYLNILGKSTSYGIGIGRMVQPRLILPQLPDTFDFGTVSMVRGSVRYLPIVMPDSGTVATKVRVTFRGAAGPFQKSDTGLIVLAPGDKAELKLTYAILQSRSDTVTLHFEFDSLGTTLFRQVVLTATSESDVTNLQLSTNLLDFGTVRPGEYKDLWLQLTTPFQSDINPDIVVNQVDHPFQVMSFEGLHTIVRPEFRTVTVRFTPTSTAAMQDTLWIQHNAVNLPNPAPVVLRGNMDVSGVPTESVAERSDLLHLYSSQEADRELTAVVDGGGGSAVATLDLYSVDGRHVASLYEGELPYDGLRIPNVGSKLATGSYVIILNVDGQTEGKIFVVR